MTARNAVVSALVALCTLPPFASLAASPSFDISRMAHPSTGSRGALSFHVGTAAGPRVYGPASRVSVPDGAGGLYISWADVRDGGGDIFLLRVTNAGTVAAGWPADGLPVCNAPGDQFESILMPDGSNGVIVGWTDFRDNWISPDGYAQRVNASGVPQWTANGVKVVSGILVNDATAVPDGTGGLLVAWSGAGAVDKDIFATRLTNTGALAAGWSTSGTLVCGSAADQVSAVVTRDGTGGAIIAWEDARGGTGQTHVFAQRLNASAVEQWAANGIQIDAALLSSAALPTICSDGGTGALVFWFDSSSPDMIVGQRLDSGGNAQWTAGGLGVGGSGAVDGEIAAVADGLSGAIVSWRESPGAIASLRAQRVNSAGAEQWGVSGASVVSIANSSPALTDVVPDGAGAAYFMWEDLRNTGSPFDVPDIYAQRITSTGAVGWTLNGTPVCVSSGGQMAATGALDGSGGLVVAWQDQRNFDTDIYAQHYTSAGAAQLAANGLAVFNNPGMQVGEFAVQSDDGGVLVFYNEKRNGQWDVRARKFTATGVPAGAAVVICSAAGHQGLSAVIDDGAGGAIVTWTDRRSGDDDIYAQRVDINCAPQWTANGVAICATTGEQQLARLTTDGAGGAIFAWQDDRNPTNADVYAQRVNMAGAVQWTANGVAVCADAGSQQGAVIASDGAGGAIISWSDFRNSLAPAVYAQRLNASGVAQWTANGVSIAGFSTITAVRVSDAVTAPSNAAIVLISEPTFDLVNGAITSILHAQKVDGAGAPQWGATGTTVCDVSSLCSHEHIVDDGAGGAYVAWSDGRASVFDIYMQRLNSLGAVQWAANGIAVCNATGWQYLDGLMRDATGDAYLTWEDQRAGQADIYAHRFNAAGAAQWAVNGVLVSGATRGQYFASIAPWKTAAPARVYVAWTDNRAGDVRYIYLQRLGSTGTTLWGVDGTTPTALSMVSATAEVDRVRLVWYAAQRVAATVYRRTQDQDWLAIGTANSDGGGQIAFEDRDVVAGARYGYRLGFFENGAETLAGEVWVTIPTNLRFTLDGLTPNPAVNDLTVSFSLPTEEAATLEMIDLAGRRLFVRELALPAGHHTLHLDQAPPAAGVYFVKLTQKNRTATARAVFLR